MRNRNPHVPQIAQSCPNINAIQTLCNEIGMYAEDIWNHYENENEGGMSDNIDYILQTIHDISNDVEEIRNINQDLRDACTDLADDLWRREEEIDQLERDIRALEEENNRLESERNFPS